MRFSDRLRQERLRRHLSQETLAEALGVSPRSISRWEQGKVIPQAVIRLQLSRFFDLPPEALFDKDEATLTSLPDEMPPPNILFNDNASSQPVPADFEDLHYTPAPFASVVQKQGLENQSSPSQRLFHRRNVLLGLGGLGLTALTVSGLWPAFHTSASQRVPTSKPSFPLQVPLSQRTHTLFDPNNSNWVNHLAWSPDSNLLAVASGSNVIMVWNIEKEAIVLAYPTLNKWVNDVSWSRSNVIAAATADLHAGSLQIWRFPEKTPLFSLQRGYALRSANWSPDGNYVAISGHSPLVEVWNPFTAQQVSQYTDTALGLLGITRVKWSPSGKYLACAADDGNAYVWEALTGKQLTIYRGHQSSVHDLSWSPDGRFIVSASTDKTSHVWEVSSGQTLAVYRGHTDIVEGVNWSPGGDAIASASADHTVHVWTPFPLELKFVYVGFKSITETALWSTNRTMLAIGTDEEGVNIWSAPRV